MDARALGRHKEQDFSTGVSVAATHDTESKRLCGPSPVVPHISNPVCGGFRSTTWSEDRIGNLWRTRSALVLLAFTQASDSLSPRVVNRGAGVRAAVFVSDEHGESAAVRHHLPRNRDSPVFQTKILAIAAPRAHLHLDLRPFCTARDGNGFLGCYDFDN